jgi:hypothetical protein
MGGERIALSQKERARPESQIFWCAQREVKERTCQLDTHQQLKRWTES